MYVYSMFAMCFCFSKMYYVNTYCIVIIFLSINIIIIIGTNEVSSPFVKSNPLLHYSTARNKGFQLSPKIIFNMAANFVSAIVQVLNFGVDNLMQEDKNQLHGPPLVGRKLIAVSHRLDMKTFINISQTLNSTVNDVFISCIAGAVKSVDPSISNLLICMMLGGFTPGAFGTQNATTFVGFRTDLTQESSVLRLQEVSNNIRCLKMSGLPLGMLLIAFVIGNVLPEFLMHRLSRLVPATFGASNVRGPHFEYSIVGDYVTDLSAIIINAGCFSKYQN